MKYYLLIAMLCGLIACGGATDIGNPETGNPEGDALISSNETEPVDLTTFVGSYAYEHDLVPTGAGELGDIAASPMPGAAPSDVADSLAACQLLAEGQGEISLTAADTALLITNVFDYPGIDTAIVATVTSAGHVVVAELHEETTLACTGVLSETALFFTCEVNGAEACEAELTKQSL